MFVLVFCLFVCIVCLFSLFVCFALCFCWGCCRVLSYLFFLVGDVYFTFWIYNYELFPYVIQVI